MNSQALEPGTVAYQAYAERAALVESGFTQDEIASLFRLRQWYQDGGSDRMNVVRHLEFLKFLIMHGKLEA
jgi:hypothetical protein